MVPLSVARRGSFKSAFNLRQLVIVVLADATGVDGLAARDPAQVLLEAVDGSGDAEGHQGPHGERQRQEDGEGEEQGLHEEPRGRPLENLAPGRELRRQVGESPAHEDRLQEEAESRDAEEHPDHLELEARLDQLATAEEGLVFLVHGKA